MKRSEFLKKLGIGIVTVPIAGKIFKEVDLSEIPDMGKEVGYEYPDYEFKNGEYLHREEDIHRGFPLRINDLIAINDPDNQYLVTAVGGDILSQEAEWARCTPLKDGPVVYATKETKGLIQLLHLSNINPEKDV